MSTLLAAATDMMLLNILPSQYNQFVACLKSFKRRSRPKLLVFCF
jgi:hypothetical protein